MGILDSIMGRTPVNPPEAAGGIPVNAQPANGLLSGRDTSKGMFSGKPIQGQPPAPSFKPGAMTPFANNVGQQMGPAQLMPDAQMMPAAATQPGGMQGNPMMMQALMQRMRGGAQ